tara:strand:- start:1023 stop:1604 length:582 start_codon:yes stop_codon:yes gene_type:complete
MNYEKKKILTDVDGVVLDWESSFTAWMSKEGYEVVNENVYKQSKRYGIEQQFADTLVKTFNESAWIGYIKPLRDAVSVIDEMLSEHYHFEAITSLSTDHWAGELRRVNLERFFGRSAFRRVRCIETGGDKDDILKEYDRGHWWVEDKPENCLAGLEAGHRPILIDHPFNRDFSHPDVVRAENWKQVFTIVKSS